MEKQNQILSPFPLLPFKTTLNGNFSPRQKPLNIHAQPGVTARIHICKGHIISWSISARSAQTSLFSSLTDTYIKHYFFSLPQPLWRSKGQKQCEIMSLLREGLWPHVLGELVKSSFLTRQSRRGLESRRGVSSSSPLFRPNRHAVPP